MPVETAPEVVAAFASYEIARRRGGHLMPVPGDRLPLTGVDVTVVSADGVTLTRPLDGAGQPNPVCVAAESTGANRGENPRSIGVRVRFGAFRFLDLGDLVRDNLAQLVCPT